MPLATEETTVGDAIEAVREYIDAIDAELDDDDLDTETDYAAALRNQRGTLEHYRAGLVWARDEAGWGADTDLVLGAPTAAEEALMDRERPRDASAAESRLWFVAAGTQAAPYHHEDNISATFADLGQTHPGFVKWAEGKLNTLSTPGNLRAGSPAQPSDGTTTSPDSSTQSETPDSATSPTANTASTSSSSDSPTD